MKKKNFICAVSTHSRPKAAGCGTSRFPLMRWPFQLTAARRRLDLAEHMREIDKRVSTHSRPKAAG